MIVLLRRCHGLTHLVAPFAVSSKVLVLEDADAARYGSRRPKVGPATNLLSCPKST